MEYHLVGTIIKTIGLKGEVKVYPKTHFRDSRFKKGNHLFLSKDGEVVRTLIVKGHKKNGNCDNLIFEEISSIEEAEKIVHYDLLAEKDEKLLKKEMYFYSDLEGCDVYFDNGDYIGKVKKIEEYTTYQTLRIERKEGKDVLVPFLKAFILELDLEEKKIIVKYIDGLL